MLRNNGCVLLAALALGGCVKQSPSVYVDLQSILYSEGPTKHPAPVSSKPPQALSMPSAALPPLPEEVIAEPPQRGGGSAEELLRANRVKAYRDLEAHLGEVYLADVHRAEEEQLGMLEPAKTQAEQEARQKLREVFERYASQRGPLVTQIALIAGFPDPDPDSKRQPVVDNTLTRIRMNAARRIRTQIAELDKTYDGDARTILSGLEHRADAELTRIKAEMEIARSEAEGRARKEAAKQVRAIEKGMGPSLIAQREVVLPSVAGKSLPPSSVPLIPAQPLVTAPNVMDDPASRMRRLSDELAIWVAVNGYRQAESRAAGQDRTSEFIQWRKSHRLGP